MEKLDVKIILKEGVPVPEYKTELSAGFDLIAHSLIKSWSVVSANPEGFTIAPNSRVLVGTGTFIELPKGKVLDIRTRSGMALNEGVFVLNSPGTIDADYRGEIGVILFNTNSYPVFFKFGERVAQGVIIDHHQANFQIVTELSNTKRGDGGYGSTGK